MSFFKHLGMNWSSHFPIIGLQTLTLVERFCWFPVLALLSSVPARTPLFLSAAVQTAYKFKLEVYVHSVSNLYDVPGNKQVSLGPALFA